MKQQYEPNLSPEDIAALLAEKEDHELIDILRERYLLNNEGFAITEKVWEDSVLQWQYWRGNMANYLSRERMEALAGLAGKMVLTKAVTLPLLDFIITTHCTLRCKKCFHLIPSYTHGGRHPFHVELETMKADLEKLLDAVDFVIKVNILGGEPFLYPRLADLLRYCAMCKKVGYFNIVSNGTVLPGDDVCKLLQNEKLFVSVNDYGVVSAQTDRVIQKLQSAGVKCRLQRNPVWFDFGDLRKLRLGEEKLKLHYAHCDFAKCKALMEGELHTCAFHKHGQRNRLLPDDHDSLHIHRYQTEELRQRLIEFYRTPWFAACDYCRAPSGNHDDVIPAGEQEDKEQSDDRPGDEI